MSAPSPGSLAQPRRSALKADGDGDRTPTPDAPVRAVQIAEPETPAPEDPQVKKQFSAGVAKRLSGRPPLSNTPSRSSTLSQLNMEALVDPKSPPLAPVPEDSLDQQPHSHHGHRLELAAQRILSQVADWLEREKVKKEQKKSRSHAHTLRRKSPAAQISIPVPQINRPRGDSIGSDSSEVSLDRLQKILDDSMTSLGLSTTPPLGPRFGRRHRKRSSRSLIRAASSDTEWVDDDVVVPSCDAFLDNSKSLAYTGGKAGADDSASISSRKEEKDKQNWITFKNEIIRVAHTLRLKGWRRVPLDGGESISVERLSGALTNAVYVVSPPSESVLPREPGKRQPKRLLLRVYGPQVEHLIDRQTELSVLKRLARKKIGPRLLGTFRNGRFEQYLNATALTASIMREPDTSRQIAKRMRELHDGIELLKEERDQGPAVWKNWDKWFGQVEKTVLFLDKHVVSRPETLPGGVWKTRGYVCGVQWPVFKGLVDKYRKHVEAYYGDARSIRDKLVFAHNDAQYGNILRFRPDDQKSPLLQPANEHKQLVVIDFEYAGANVPGFEFANHFSEWAYNYHDPARPYACNTTNYPSPDQQRRFVKAYVDHRPQFPYVDTTADSPAPTPPLLPTTRDGTSNPSKNHPDGARPGGTGALHTTPSTSSIVEFMLDARVPPGGWKEEERKREEAAERRVKELLDETRLWRTANSAQWVAWGIVQAKIPGLDTNEGAGVKELEGGAGAGEGEVNGTAHGDEDGGEEHEEEFDYLAYAQDRAYFFLGDCVLLGLVKAEELGEEVVRQLKLVDH